MFGYGSHAYLNEYIYTKGCKRILEIGVYNGENAKMMVETALQNASPNEVEYYGFDFFWHSRIQEVREKLSKTGCNITLVKGNTENTLPKTVRTLPKMDLIFIDGGKSYREAKSDWEHSKTLMHDGTAVFVHNYYFSGVRKMVDNISRDEYQVKIIHTPYDSDTALINKKAS